MRMMRVASTATRDWGESRYDGWAYAGIFWPPEP